MQRLSYPTETVLSIKITRNRIVLSFKDSPRKPLGRWHFLKILKQIFKGNFSLFPLIRDLLGTFWGFLSLSSSSSWAAFPATATDLPVSPRHRAIRISWSRERKKKKGTTIRIFRQKMSLEAHFLYRRRLQNPRQNWAKPVFSEGKYVFQSFFNSNVNWGSYDG